MITLSSSMTLFAVNVRFKTGNSETKLTPRLSDPKLWTISLSSKSQGQEHTTTVFPKLT